MLIFQGTLFILHYCNDYIDFCSEVWIELQIMLLAEIILLFGNVMKINLKDQKVIKCDNLLSPGL